MFTLEDALMLIMFAIVMTTTPGPNNVLLLASGVTFGVLRTGWHVAGILAGVFLQIGLVGAGLGAIFSREPGIQVALKFAGSLYMVWLAHRLWRASSVQSAVVMRPIRFFEAAGFQFLNPKAWLMATTVISVFVAPGDHYAARVVTSGLIFCATALPCIVLWAASGEVLRRWVRDSAALKRMNRAMALLALATVLLLWA